MGEIEISKERDRDFERDRKGQRGTKGTERRGVGLDECVGSNERRRKDGEDEHRRAEREELVVVVVGVRCSCGGLDVDTTREMGRNTRRSGWVQCSRCQVGTPTHRQRCGVATWCAKHCKKTHVVEVEDEEMPAAGEPAQRARGAWIHLHTSRTVEVETLCQD